jgi:hypothetical protein
MQMTISAPDGRRVTITGDGTPSPVAVAARVEKRGITGCWEPQ